MANRMKDRMKNSFRFVTPNRREDGRRVPSRITVDDERYCHFM